jgi:chemotaxis protein MotA
MNLMSLVAFILAGAVLVFGISTAGDWHFFLDPHAVFIVIGGSMAAGSIAFQVDRILLLFKVFVRRVLRGRRENYARLIRELMILAEAYRTNAASFDKLVKDSEDFFLKEAIQAMLDDVLQGEELIRVLRTRVATVYARHTEDVIKLKAIGKYPPAFGLMGTTLSMITLLQKLGEPGGQKLIGPAMALGLVATFFGLALANLVFQPIAENLHDSAREARLKNIIIVEGVRLIAQKTNPIVLAEELNSYLLPSERIDWKHIKNLAASDKEAA